MQRQATRLNTSEDNHTPVLAEFEAGETVPTPVFSINTIQPSAPPVEESHASAPLDTSINLMTMLALEKIHAEEQQKLLENFMSYLRGDDNLAVFKGVRTTGGTPDFTEPLMELDSKHQSILKTLLKERINNPGVFSPRTLVKKALTPTSLIGTAFLFASPALRIALALGGILHAVYSQYSHQQIILERANILLAKLPLDIDEPEIPHPTATTGNSWIPNLSLFSRFREQNDSTNPAPASENKPAFSM
jgi:hypothetical protein